MKKKKLKGMNDISKVIQGELLTRFEPRLSTAKDKCRSYPALSTASLTDHRAVERIWNIVIE